MQYEYDAYGNMTYREDGNWGNDEDFEYDNLNRPQVLRRGDITYDGKGNITAHDAAGAFSYASSKPYALSQIALAVTDFPTATQTITYNSMNRPDTISEGSVTARFKYFEDGERSQMIVSGSNCYNVHKYFGTQFTTLDLNEQGYEGQKQILFLGGDAYTAQAALVREKDSGSSTWSQSLYYIVRDNLGSITQVVDSTGMVAQELSYDAWGRLRAPETLQPYAPNSQPNLLLGRGFCGHEHLPKFNLINMNARLYDPWASRFLSPDPYVQLPDFTQSLNRYSYCLNNPLKYCDPSGELIDDSYLTQIQRAHYIYELGKLRGNRFFDAFYDKIQRSSTIFTLKYGDTSKYSNNPQQPIGAFFDDYSQTIILNNGGSFNDWDLCDEFYHAYQYINHTHRDGHNAEYEAHVAAMLSHTLPVSIYNGQQEFANNIIIDKYGTYEEDSHFSEDKELLFFIDYIYYGQLFLNDKTINYPLYKLPIFDCPPLLLNLMRQVF